MKLPFLRSANELRALVEEVGCMPLFRSCIPGFSVEALTPDEYWFKEDTVGPWEWRSEIASEHRIAYAKLFGGKYGFVSMDLYPHLANLRRDGYDFDARFEDGLVKDRERRLYSLIENGTKLSTELRKAYTGKDFEAAMTGLQMSTYVTVAGFDRRRNKRGEPYGWELCVYDISENVFGDVCSAAYDYSPEESYSFIEARLGKYLDAESVRRLLL